MAGVKAETTPRAFLCYASEDRELASKIAITLQANGIDTWWDKWCIGPGDSLRQKIDEGLSDCTHFIVLQTPASIKKPWVNQEMDAGLVRKIRAQCKFTPLRHGLPAEALPPLLSGMLSPEISDPDSDLPQLVYDIFGVSRKPPLGAPPAIATLGRALQHYFRLTPDGGAFAGPSCFECRTCCFLLCRGPPEPLHTVPSFTHRFRDAL